MRGLSAWAVVACLGAGVVACASNETYLRREVAPLAARLFSCPVEQVATQCADKKCYQATASGCGRSVQYDCSSGDWHPIGPPTSAPTTSLATASPGTNGGGLVPEPPQLQGPSTLPAQGPPVAATPAVQPQPPIGPAPQMAGGPAPQQALAPAPAPLVPISPAATPAAALPITPSTYPSAGQAVIPGAPQPTAYAVIVGVERYPSLPPPAGARADAEAFAQVARHSLGVPPSQIRVALDADASRGRIERDLVWAANNVPAGGRIYFFFSGHGAPDPTKSTSYIVPYDGDPQYLEQTSLKLDRALEQLRASKAKNVVAFVDACFSGAGGRSVLAPGARPLVRTKAVPAPSNTVLFTASGPDEISGPANNGRGGLFSWHLMQGLGTGRADLNGDGQITAQELSDYVVPRVSRDAAGANRAQTPKLKSGEKTESPGTLVLEWGLAPN